MEKRITKHHFKYGHAYDEFGNCISLENSINDKRPYFFDKGKQIKLYFATSSNGYLHWRAYPKQKFIDKNGVEYDYASIENKLSESLEHLNFKRSIVERGYFIFQRNKVYIQNALEEERIINSRYESDVSGQLLDGTPCIVEVIKTSDLSEKKLNHIEENQILTFKIYIDEYGNQIPESDNIVGNREIKQIKESIQNGEGQLAELRERRIEAKREYQERINNFREGIEREKELAIKEVDRIKTECRQIEFGASGEVEETERRNDRLRKEYQQQSFEITRLEDSIQRLEYEIERIERAKQRSNSEMELELGEIKRMETECNAMENTFNEIATRCEVEWFRNKWMTAPIQNKIEELKYWTS